MLERNSDFWRMSGVAMEIKGSNNRVALGGVYNEIHLEGDAAARFVDHLISTMSPTGNSFVFYLVGGDAEEDLLTQTTLTLRRES